MLYNLLGGRRLLPNCGSTWFYDATREMNYGVKVYWAYQAREPTIIIGM